MTTREQYEAWFRGFYKQEPMPELGAPAHDFCWAGYKAGRQAEVESLRQQLSAAQETLKDHGEIQAALCKQLSAALAACKVKDEAIASQMKVTSWEEQVQANDLSEDALAIQPHLDLIAKVPE